MSLLVGLGPLLDPGALLMIARQLFATRDRLSLRTGGNLPTVTELALALRMYAARQDRARLQSANPLSATPSHATTPSPFMLARYLAIADTAYATSHEAQAAALELLDVAAPIAACLAAGRWAPGYFVAPENRTRTLFVVVRGSKEVSDFLTNLSADTEPFLDGHGHQGVVKSAERLLATLAVPLRGFVDAYHATRVVFLGHSLGGAVAAAITLLLRAGTEAGDGAVGEVLRSAKCFSFGAPPFLCADTARRSDDAGITSLVHNLDVVPRLSAASVDRLLVAVSRYDWGNEVTEWVGRTVGMLASGILPTASASGLSETVRRGGTTGLAAASASVGGTARALGSVATPSGWGNVWRAAAGATAAVSELVAVGLQGSQRRLRNEETGFAREFGMDASDVERVLADGPGEVFVAGEVWVVERRFTDPAAEDAVDKVEMGRLRRIGRDELSDVEVSGWMVYDHAPSVIIAALLGVAHGDDEGETS